MRNILFALLLALSLGAQTLVVSVAEITGTSAAVAVSSSGVARWVLFAPLSTNSAAVRCGASNVSASAGTPIAAGGGLFWPPIANAPGYDLTKTYCYITTGDKLDVSYAK